MTFFLFTNKSLARYLLGELSTGKRRRIEIGYLSGDRLHERILLAEDDLIDSYLDERLSADRRARFEAWFLASPERQDKLELARNIRKISQRNVPSGAASRPRRLWLRLALAGATGLAAVAVVLSWRWRTTYEAPRITARSSRSQATDVASSPTLAFVLTPATRSLEDTGNTVHIPGNPVTIRLLLQTFEPLKSHYRATIHPVDGGPDITASANITGPDHKMAVDLPSEALAAGEYDVFFEERMGHGKWRQAGGAAFRVVREERK